MSRQRRASLQKVQEIEEVPDEEADAASPVPATADEGKKTKTVKLPAAVLKGPAPISQMHLLQLRAAMNRDIMHQDGAIDVLCSMAVRAWRHHIEPEGEPGQPHIIKALLAGPSGVGKTESIQRLRHYLGQSRGWVHEKQYIAFDASTCTDSTSSTRITGASAGYAGYGDVSLADLMIEAGTPVETREVLALPFGKERDKRLKNIKARMKRGMGPLGPPVILLFIDEIDKAHPDFLLALNGLLDTGRITSANGHHFELSRATTLLCLFTSNFADRKIAAMKDRQRCVGQCYVEEAILAKGMQKCTLERFGQILVYFSLTRNELREVMRAKLEAYIKRGHVVSRRYRQVDYDDRLKRILVEHVLDQADKERGVRNSTRLLFENLDNMFEEAFAIIEHHLSDPTTTSQLDADGPFNAFAHTFDASNIEAELRGKLASVMDTAANRRALATYQQNSSETVKAVGLRQRETVIVLNVLETVPLRAALDYADDAEYRIRVEKNQKREWRNICGGLHGVVREAEAAMNETAPADERCDKVIDLFARKSQVIRAIEEMSDSDEDVIDERRRFFEVAQGRHRRPALRGRVSEVVSVEEPGPEESGEEPVVPNKRKRDDTVTCRACHEEKAVTAFGKSSKRDSQGQVHEYRRSECYACAYKKRKLKKQQASPQLLEEGGL